jgi:photosystem II stability/assembly factor-like uncharacterized protein
MKAPLALLLAVVLLVLLIPADAVRGSSFSADLTLLGLGADLHGVYVSSEGWMLLAGKGGILAYAEKGEVWTYRFLSYGGSDLTAVVFSGSSGLVVGKGRALLVEGIKGSFTVREVPFLRGDFAAAVWSLDSSFAALLSSDGRVFEPGEVLELMMTRDGELYARVLGFEVVEVKVPEHMVPADVPEVIWTPPRDDWRWRR